MPGCMNAASELTRFWLEERHGYLVRESVPVPIVIHSGDALSALDMVTLAPSGTGGLTLPSGVKLGPRLVVEVEDDRDRDQAIIQRKLLRDVELMGMWPYIPHGAAGTIKFTILCQEHYDIATKLFGTDAFDRLFVVHALDPEIRAQVAPALAQHRIHWLTLPELVADLVPWVQAHSRPASLRHSLIGDLLTLLVGHCRLNAPMQDL